MKTLFLGRIQTMNPNVGFTDGVLVGEDGLVEAIGLDAVRVDPLATMRNIRFDARCVVPGLVDYHGHNLFVLAEGAGDLSVLKTKKHDERNSTVRQLLRAQIDRQPQGTVVMGNWSTSAMSAKEMKQIVDETAGDREVLVIEASWHSACASSALLNRVGLAIGAMQHIRGAFDGCCIHEDWVIQTLGMLRIDVNELYERILRREQSLLARGIVEVHDKLVLGVPLLTAMIGLSVTGRLTIPVRGSVQPVMMRQFPSLVRPGRYGTHFELVGLKYLADGAFGNKKAAMCLEAKRWRYTDGSMGELLLPAEREVREDVEQWRELGGTEVNVHCIGPEAVRQTLLLFESILDSDSGKGLTLGFEHFETVMPTVGRTVARLQRSGVRVRVCSQYGFNSDLTDYVDRLPESLRNAINPFRTLRQEGVEWVGGTDGPITGDDYWGGMHMVVHRPGPEAITVEEALCACCRPLKVGDKFTAAVLDMDPFAYPEHLKDVHVLQTWIGNKKVYTT